MSTLPLVALVVLWWALIIYAVLGGADFGAGVWDLFAVGRQADSQHKLINHALGPVWEANHVWLIFLIVGMFTIFPAAFYALSIALFFPITIALIGIVARGAAFVFRYYAVKSHGPFEWISTRIFSITSVITPFFLGISAAAVASDNLIPTSGIPSATYIQSWTSPFAIVIGLMAVSICATVAAIYLAVEAHETEKDEEMAELYRRNGLIAGAITAVLGALGLFLSMSQAPILWDGLVQRSIPIVVVTMLIGLGAAATLYLRRYGLARALIILEVAFLLGSWGLSQYPYIIPTAYTISNSANEPSVILALLIAFAVGACILIPSLYYLFSVFKLPMPVPGMRRNNKEQPIKQAQSGSGGVGSSAD